MNTADDSTSGCHDISNKEIVATSHRLLHRVLSVPGGSKRRRRVENSNAGGSGGNSKSSVA